MPTKSPTVYFLKAKKCHTGRVIGIAQVIFEIFVGVFGVGLMGMCLYWLFGDVKRKQQTVANVLIYLWGFMLFGLVVGIINSLVE